MSDALEPTRSFQGLILTLQRFWAEQGCVILQPYDMQMGAGTFHTATTLRALGPEALEGRLCAALAPPQGRPLRRKPQPAAALLPVPGDPEAVAADNIQDLYLQSLAAIGLDRTLHDIRFVEDDWESPTLGAWGLGWECWCDGMEVSQFTYFQQVAGFECKPVSGEITYGLERLAMYVQGVENVYDLNFNGREGDDKVTYGDVFLQNEQEFSQLQFRGRRHRHAVPPLRRRRGRVPGAARRAGADGNRHDHGRPRLRAGASRPRHNFNLLDARGVISVTERQSYILRIRELAKACGAAWLQTAGGGFVAA